MIELNLLEKKKGFKAPVVLGVDLAKLPWIPMIISYALATYPIEYIKEEFESEQTLKSKEVNIFRGKLNKLKAELRKNKGIKDQLGAFNKQIERLKKRSDQVDKIIQQRTNPRYILEKIARSTPDDLWFNELIITDKFEITIKGGAESYTSIGDFIVDVNESPFFGRTLQLKDSKTEELPPASNGYVGRQETFIITGQVKVFDPFLTGR